MSIVAPIFDMIRDEYVSFDRVSTEGKPRLVEGLAKAQMHRGDTGEAVGIHTYTCTRSSGSCISAIDSFFSALCLGRLTVRP